MIRFAQREDLPHAVDLHRRTWRVPPNAPDDLDYEAIFFDHPWYHDRIRSLVWEEEGEVKGFAGVVARPIRVGENEEWMAVTSRFMVEKGAIAPLRAVQLIQAVKELPAAFVYTDQANGAARRFLVRAGGEVVTSRSIRWVRAFRPAESLRRWVSNRPDWIGAVARAGALATWPVDGLADRLAYNRFSEADSVESVPDPAGQLIAEAFQKAAAWFHVHPVVDSASVAWQLERLARFARGREVHASIVRTASGRPLGWYIYYLDPKGVATVLQLHGLPSFEGIVVHRLFQDLLEQGAVDASGLIAAGLLHALSESRCRFRAGDSWTVLIGGSPGVRAAVHGQGAFLSQLEGEWW